MDANDTSTQGQNPEAPAAEEGQPTNPPPPPSQTYIRQPGKSPLINDDVEAGDRSAHSLYLPQKPSHPDCHQRLPGPPPQKLVWGEATTALLNKGTCATLYCLQHRNISAVLGKYVQWDAVTLGTL